MNYLKFLKAWYWSFIIIRHPNYSKFVKAWNLLHCFKYVQMKAWTELFCSWVTMRSPWKKLVISSINTLFQICANEGDNQLYVLGSPNFIIWNLHKVWTVFCSSATSIWSWVGSFVILRSRIWSWTPRSCGPIPQDINSAGELQAQRISRRCRDWFESIFWPA